MRFNARSRIFICACWQPKLKMVAPATLGLLMYPASKLQSVTASEVDPPQPPSCVRKCRPSTFGKIRFRWFCPLLVVRSSSNNSSSEAPDLYFSTSSETSKLFSMDFHIQALLACLLEAYQYSYFDKTPTELQASCFLFQHDHRRGDSPKMFL